MDELEKINILWNKNLTQEELNDIIKRNPSFLINLNKQQEILGRKKRQIIKKYKRTLI